MMTCDETERIAHRVLFEGYQVDANERCPNMVYTKHWTARCLLPAGHTDGHLSQFKDGIPQDRIEPCAGTPRIEREVQLSRIIVDRLPIGVVSLRYANIAQAAGDKWPFPAIKCGLRADGALVLLDGRHRFLAAKLVGHKTILAKWSPIAMTSQSLHP